MSYEPTSWQTGDVVTAEKLNKLENGVAGSSSSENLIATLTYNSADSYFTLDKSWQDIKNALDAGGIVVAKETYNEESSDSVSADIWYLLTIMPAESSVGDLSYGARFMNILANEKIVLTATDPNAPLMTLEDGSDTPT